MHHQRLLICHAGALGDFILTWPALLGLKRHHKNFELLAVGRRQFLDLAIKYGLIDHGFDLESREMMDFFQGLKIPDILGKPDGAVLWFKNAGKIVADLLLPVCSGPVVRINPFPPLQMHLSDYYCAELNRHFSVPYPENITSLLPSANQGQTESAVIHPGSGSPLKKFSAGFYLKIRSILHSYGFKKIIIILGPAEYDIGADTFPGAEIIRPPDVLALADKLERTRLFVGNDSGVSHLAGFLGIPTVVFYRCTDPHIWGVRGRRVWHLRAQQEEKARRLFSTLLDKLNNKKFF
jgi:heptosyltransferase-3